MPRKKNKNEDAKILIRMDDVGHKKISSRSFKFQSLFRRDMNSNARRCGAMILFSFLIIFSGLLYSFVDATVGCRGFNDEILDWFYVYKHPIKYTDVGHDREYSDKYLYITSDQPDVGWTLSSDNINETSSLIAKTIIQVMDDEQCLFMTYNDENPNGKTERDHGHTKGVVGADARGGFWLVHSLPKFPRTDQYEYANTREYGQSFLCISLNASQLDLAGQKMIYNEPNVYYSRISESLKSTYPYLHKVASKLWVTKSPYWSVGEVSSLEGTTFRVFAKGPRFQKELYEDLVAPVFQSELFVQTWLNGVEPLPSNCSKKFHVINISALKWPNYSETYPTSADHSKWAVTNQHDANWICVGDINRMQHQLQRGGGTVCQNNESIARAFRDAIANTQPCYNPPKDTRSNLI